MKDIPIYNQDKKENKKTQSKVDYEEGLEHLKKGETAQAANMFHNALIGFQQENDINGIANATNKLADICAERRELDKAIQMYDRIIDICFNQGDNVSVFSIDKKKTRLYADCGQYEQAISGYLNIIEQYQLMRNPQGTVETLDKLADVYISAGDLQKAADCYHTAAAIHTSFKHKRHAAELSQKADELLAQI